MNHSDTRPIGRKPPAWAAEIMGLTPRTLANWRCQGKGPRYMKIGSRVYYDPDDVYAYMRSCKLGWRTGG